MWQEIATYLVHLTFWGWQSSAGLSTVVKADGSWARVSEASWVDVQEGLIHIPGSSAGMTGQLEDVQRLFSAHSWPLCVADLSSPWLSSLVSWNSSTETGFFLSKHSERPTWKGQRHVAESWQWHAWLLPHGAQESHGPVQMQDECTIQKCNARRWGSLERGNP